MARIKIIFFDINGTITYNIVYPERMLIKEFNLDIREEELEKSICGVSKNHNDYINKVIKRMGIVKTQKNFQKVKRILQKEADKVKLRKGFKKTIKELAKDYPLGLISNSFPAGTKRFFKLLGNMKKYFSTIILSEDCGLLKPNKAIYELALQETGLKAKEAIMIGNSVGNDVIPSKKIGFKGILFDQDRVYSSKERKNADVTVFHPAEIMLAIENVNIK